MDGISWIGEKIKDHRRRPFGPPIRDTRLKRRAILKNGEYNILPPKFKRRYLYYVRDFFTGLVDAEWKWTLQVMAIGFTGCWIIFSLIWYLIAFVHKDLHDDHLPARQAETGWTPCVLNIHGWPSCFLYSLETQHTTGYGLRVITEECPEAIFLMCFQCIIGMIIDTFTVGVVVAKLMRPRLTNYMIQFSCNAVVCLRDGELCLMYRMGDLRKSRLVGVSIGALLIQNKVTKEGETLKYFETELDVECDSTGSDLFFIWPVTVIHKINEESPFYNLSASDMLQAKFEIIATLDGTVESTGQGTNAKTSYLSNEILWGHRFESMVSFNEKLQCYEANYKNFEKLVKIEMPTCSAADLATRGSGTEEDGKDEDKETKSITDPQSKISLEQPSPSKKDVSSRPTSALSQGHKALREEVSPTDKHRRRERNVSIYTSSRSPDVLPQMTPKRLYSQQDQVYTTDEQRLHRNLSTDIPSRSHKIPEVPSTRSYSLPNQILESGEPSPQRNLFIDTSSSYSNVPELSSRHSYARQSQISNNDEPIPRRDVFTDTSYGYPNVPEVPSRRSYSEHGSIPETVQYERPSPEYYESRRYAFEQEGTPQRIQPRSGKSMLNRYEYLRSTQCETIYEGDERSETPPFPISWV